MGAKMSDPIAGVRAMVGKAGREPCHIQVCASEADLVRLATNAIVQANGRLDIFHDQTLSLGCGGVTGTNCRFQSGQDKTHLPGGLGHAT